MESLPFRPAKQQGVLQVTLFVDPAVENRWFVEVSVRQLVRSAGDHPTRFLTDVDQVCREVRDWLLKQLDSRTAR